MTLHAEWSVFCSALPNWMVCGKLLVKLNRTTPTLGIKLSGTEHVHFTASHDIYISNLHLSLDVLSACLSASRCLCLAGSACLHTSAPADLDSPSFQADSSAASRQTRQLPHSLQKTQINSVPAPVVALLSQARVANKSSSASDAPLQVLSDPKLPEDSLHYFANFVCSHDAKGFRAALDR